MDVNKTDYRRKLARDGGSPPLPVDCETPACVRQLGAMKKHPERGTLAFQGVAAAALQALERAAYRERRAADAALLLAHREKLNRMAETSEAAARALKPLLNVQGAALLRPTPHAEEKPETSWWFGLSEALQGLEEDIAWIRSVGAGQPRGSAAHTLSMLVLHLLGAHYGVVFAEAEHWIA